MKKLYVLVAFVLLGIGTAQAQLGIGIKGGLNFATLSSLPDNVDNDGSRIGLVLGGYVRIKVPGAGIFVQPELVFAQKGGKSKAGGSSATIKINTLDIPIILGKSFGPIRVGLGPVFGFPLTSQVESGSVTVDAGSNTNSPLAALQIGLGLDLPSKLGLDLRYELGLTKMYDGNGAFANNDTKTNAIQLTISYKIL